MFHARFRTAIFALLILPLLLQSCSDNADTNKLIIATSADNPPYEYMQNGKIIGADIDIAHRIAEILQKDIVIQNLDFAGLMQSLAANNVDMVIAALSVTEARSKHVDFSIPYLHTKMVLMYKAVSPIANNGMLDGKVVGVQLGSTWENAAQILQGRIPSLSIRPLNNNLVLVEELKNDTIDCLILEEAQAQKFQQVNPSFTYRVLEEFSSQFAVALPKGSELLPEINQAIRTLQAEGELKLINDRWLDNNG